MASGDDISNLLQVARVEQEEFGQLMLGHFHSARGVPPNEVVYPGDAENYALKLHYANDGSLVRATAGPLLAVEDVEALQRAVAMDLLADSGTKIGRVVLFAALPLEGWFRYKEDFQIIAVPHQAPRPPYLAADHPFILEFRFRDSLDTMVSFIRREVREMELELLLNAFLFPGVHSLRRSGGQGRWVLAPRAAGEPFRTMFAQEQYTWDGFHLAGDELSEPDGLPAMARVSADEYYSRLGLTYKHGLDLPSSIEEMLDHFYRLEESEREQFLRSCFWFQQGSRARAASVRFTALISAVEALTPPAEPGPNCERCGKPAGLGLTQQFVTFVDGFAPGIPAIERRRLYDLRSALSHGGTLLHSDRATLSGGLEPNAIKEWLSKDTASRLVRAVLVGWLLRHG